MTPLAMRFCVGCGQVFDELQPFDSRPRWIAAEAYREKYGLSLNDLHLIATLARLAPACWRLAAAWCCLRRAYRSQHERASSPSHHSQRWTGRAKDLPTRDKPSHHQAFP